MTVDGVKVTFIGENVISENEALYYLNEHRKKVGKPVIEMEIEVDGEFVNVKFKYPPVAFQRIRRITGYLVGTLDRFNNAKASEVRDRVKHNNVGSGDGI